MDFQAHEGLYCYTNMAPLRLGLAGLASLHAVALLQSPVTALYPPSLFLQRLLLLWPYAQVICCPMFHVPVRGDGPEPLDYPVAPQVNHPALWRYPHHVHPQVAAQLRQPDPAAVPHLLQVLQAAVPTVEEKDGRKGEQQRYRCGNCRRCWQPGGVYHRPGSAAKEQALAMYVDGSSLSAIGLVLGYSTQAVSQWVKKGDAGR